jgi:hypothetical protein
VKLAIVRNLPPKSAAPLSQPPHSKTITTTAQPADHKSQTSVASISFAAPPADLNGHSRKAVAAVVGGAGGGGGEGSLTEEQEEVDGGWAEASENALSHGAYAAVLLTFGSYHLQVFVVFVVVVVVVVFVTASAPASPVFLDRLLVVR